MTAYNCWRCGRVYNSAEHSCCPLCGAALNEVSRGYCPHFGEVMDLGNCFFCHFKNSKKRKEAT